MSNAIINYLAVGATALAPLGLLLPHRRDLFPPLSSLAHLGLLFPLTASLSFTPCGFLGRCVRHKTFALRGTSLSIPVNAPRTQSALKGRNLSLDHSDFLGAMIAAPIFTSRSDYLVTLTHRLSSLI